MNGLDVWNEWKKNPEKLFVTPMGDVMYLDEDTPTFKAVGVEVSVFEFMETEWEDLTIREDGWAEIGWRDGVIRWYQGEDILTMPRDGSTSELTSKSIITSEDLKTQRFFAKEQTNGN